MDYNYDELHRPVLLNEVMSFLDPKDEEIYVDCTLGAGGHAERILELSSPNGKLIGIDLDSEAIEIARKRLSRFGDRVTFIHGNFADLADILRSLGIDKVNGVLMDLGVSWMQLSNPERGFSFRLEAPLDMRMDRRNPTTASDVVNTKSEEELYDIFRRYGEERWARRIARRIVRFRSKSPITTTRQLAKIVESAVPVRRGRIHPATRVFQALRIYVNRELDNLERGLDSAIEALKPGGRICVISFHSLEDRIVKWKFRHNPVLKVLTPKPISPSDEEVRENPRSRSAKLRSAEAI